MASLIRTTVLACLLGTAAPALAAEQITFVSQGGAYQQAQTVAILDPAAKALGITINQDSAPDAWPVIRTQGATGKPTWDVVDTPTQDCVRGGKAGLIEKLDFSKIPNAAAIPPCTRPITPCPTSSIRAFWLTTNPSTARIHRRAGPISGT